jgi:hypothetical protein
MEGCRNQVGGYTFTLITKMICDQRSGSAVVPLVALR